MKYSQQEVMQFVEQEDVLRHLEDLFRHLMREVKGVELAAFPRITWQQAMDWYGTDKPDIRYDLRIRDLTDLAREGGFSLFRKVAESGGVVRAICVQGGAAFSRSEIDDLTARAVRYGAGGMAWIADGKLAAAVSEGGGLPVAFDASIRFSHLGKRCVSSAVHEKNLAFAQTLTPKDILIVLSASGQSARLEEVSAAAKGRDVPVLLITCDSHGPLAQLADYVMTASNREQRLIEGSHAASLLSPNVLIEVLYYLLRMENL